MSMGTENFDNIKNEIIDKFKIIGCQKTPSPLTEQNISKEANAIIVTLFQDYFATEEQKEKIKEILELNEKKSEQEKREKYNPDDLFKNNKTIETKQKDDIQETALVEYKENFFIKFKNFIMKILHLKS